MMHTVQQVLDALYTIAPPDIVMEGDNIGLLIGHPEQEVDAVLVALDATPDVVEEAMLRGAQLIVTHHPLLFSPRQNLREDDPEGALLCQIVRANLSMIAMHTNWDSARGGTNDALLAELGFLAGDGDGFLRVTTLSTPMPLEALQLHAQRSLGDVVRCYAASDRPVRRLAVAAGAGSSELDHAIALGADALLTGECKHHHALAAVQQGVHILECGHYATEQPGARALARGLQSAIDALQYTIRVLYSDCAPFGCVP